MKQYLVLGVGLLAGTAIGAAAVTGLHAQAKPPVYLVTEIDVTNPEAYGKEFAPKAQATIKAAGGKFVVLGSALRPMAMDRRRAACGTNREEALFRQPDRKWLTCS